MTQYIITLVKKRHDRNGNPEFCFKVGQLDEDRGWDLTDDFAEILNVRYDRRNNFLVLQTCENFKDAIQARWDEHDKLFSSWRKTPMRIVY